MIIDLRKSNLRTAEVGTVVITSAGFEWELLERKDGKETWLDESADFIWYDLEDIDPISHHEAMEKYGDNLPSKEDFELAESHGIREVLPNMDYNFWSSSVYPGNSNVARFFSGRYGNIYYAYRKAYYNYVARCADKR